MVSNSRILLAFGTGTGFSLIHSLVIKEVNFGTILGRSVSNNCTFPFLVLLAIFLNDAGLIPTDEISLKKVSNSRIVSSKSIVHTMYCFEGDILYTGTTIDREFVCTCRARFYFLVELDYGDHI